MNRGQGNNKINDLKLFNYYDMNVLSLFDGMSCLQLALNKINKIPTKYFASEVDKYAMQVTMANFPNTNQIGDVKKYKRFRFRILFIY